MPSERSRNACSQSLWAVGCVFLFLDSTASLYVAVDTYRGQHSIVPRSTTVVELVGTSILLHRLSALLRWGFWYRLWSCSWNFGGDEAIRIVPFLPNACQDVSRRVKSKLSRVEFPQNRTEAPINLRTPQALQVGARCPGLQGRHG